MSEINLNGQITLFKVKNGQDGAPGAPGKTAYDLWLEADNVGTVSDFLASLKGQDGAPGAPAFKAIITYEPQEGINNTSSLLPGQSISLLCRLYAGKDDITDEGITYEWYNKNEPNNLLGTGKNYILTLPNSLVDFTLVCKCYIDNVECAFDEFSLSEIIETTIYEVELVGTPSRFKVATAPENSTDWVYQYEISPEQLPFHIYRIFGNSREEITQEIYIGNSKNESREKLEYENNYYSFPLKDWHDKSIKAIVDEDKDEFLPVQFYLYLNEEDANPIGSFSFINAEEGKRMDVSLTASKWQALVDKTAMVFNTTGLTLYNGAFKIASTTINNGSISSTDLFYYDTTNTSLYIKTNYARIGGWCIGGSDTIDNEQYVYSENNYADTLYSSDKTIWLSPNGISTTINGNPASMVFKAGSNFGVDTLGNLYASGAKITGEIEATSLLLRPGVAQNAGLATNAQVTDAAKTATNFLQFIDGTLTIGNIEILNNSTNLGTYYYYTQITNKSFDIGRKRWYIDSTTNAPTPEETKLVSFSKEIQFYPGENGESRGYIDYVDGIDFIVSGPHLELFSQNLIMLGTESSKLCVAASGATSVSLIEARLDSENENKSFINLKNKNLNSDVCGLEIHDDGVFYCSKNNKFNLIHEGNETKNTAGATNTNNKIYLIGASSQGNHPQTYSHDTVYAGSDGYIYSNNEKVWPRIYSTLVPWGTLIPNGADLNAIEYLKVGNYYCDENAKVATLKNCPLTTYNNKGEGISGQAFMMQVYSPLSTVLDTEQTGTWLYRIRKITHYNTGIEYIQYCYVGDRSEGKGWELKDWYIKPRSKFTFNTTAASTAAIGSNLKPIYINGAGEMVAGSDYAGGTAITLNGSSKSGTTATFYAPTAAGSSGQVLTSTGGAPTWKNQSDIVTKANVKIALGTGSGTTKYLREDGTWQVPYTLPTASSSTLGGVKIGKNISLSSGTISLESGNITSALGYTPLSGSTGIPVYTQGAYNLDDCRDVGLYLFNEGTNHPSNASYGTMLSLPYRQPTGNQKPDYCAQIFFPNGDDIDGDDTNKPRGNSVPMFYRTSMDNKWNDWQEVATGPALKLTPIDASAEGKGPKVDWNELFTPGIYRYPFATDMQGVTHAPTTAAGYLIVHTILSSNSYVQEFYHYRGKEFWRRHYYYSDTNKEGWSKWWNYRAVNYEE